MISRRFLMKLVMGAPLPPFICLASSAQAQSEPEPTPIPANEAPVETSSSGPEPSAAADPEEVVVVSGTRSSRVPGSIQVIGEKQLERLDFDDANEVLRQVPGVYVREEDGTGLRPNIAMRGVNPDRSKKITLMEDGVLFGPAPYSAPAAYYFPLMERVTQVQVIKGPGSVAYGPQTVAGAIDLVTRVIPDKPSAGVDLSMGQYGYAKAHAYAGTSNEQFGVLIEGIHLGNSGFKTLPNGQNTGAARDEWMVKGSYLIDPHAAVANELSIKLGYSQEGSNETYLGLSDADFDADPNRRYPSSNLDRMENHRTNIALTHELKDDARHIELRTTMYRNDFYRIWRKFNHLGGASADEVLNDPTDPANAAYYGVLSGQTNTSGENDVLYIGPNQRKFVSQGIMVRFRRTFETGPVSHKFESGLRLHNDSIDREHSESPFAMISGDLYPLDVAPIRTTSNFAETFAGALHATDAITYKRLTVTPGLRVEAILSNLDDRLANTSSTRTDLVALPGVGAYFTITDDLGAFGGVHRGFSPPAPGSDASQTPEWSVNYEGGMRYSARKTKAEVLGFFNDYQNLTDICTFSSGCGNSILDQQFSAGRAYIYGMESLASHDLELGALRFPLSAAYTLSYGTFQNSFESADPIYGSVQKGDQMPYLPRHQFRAQLAAEYKWLGAYTAFTYVAPVREEASSEAMTEVLSTDPLYKLDLGASFQVLPMLQLNAHLRNALDYQGIASHRPFGARPNAPRWIMIGAELDL